MTTDTLTMRATDLAELVAERDMLRTQVTELQAQATRLVEERRTHLQAYVRGFFTTFGQAMPEKPSVPNNETVRFRLRLGIEEGFEKLRAACDPDDSEALIAMEELERRTMALVERVAIHVDLPAYVDAIADILYVTMGDAIAFGVDMHPVLAEVQRSNLAKVGGPVVGGKQGKPPGWTAPDITSELRKQGWAQ